MIFRLSRNTRNTCSCKLWKSERFGSPELNTSLHVLSYVRSCYFSYFSHSSLLLPYLFSSPHRFRPVTWRHGLPSICLCWVSNWWLGWWRYWLAPPSWTCTHSSPLASRWRITCLCVVCAMFSRMPSKQMTSTICGCGSVASSDLTTLLLYSYIYLYSI